VSGVCSSCTNPRNQFDSARAAVQLYGEEALKCFKEPDICQLADAGYLAPIVFEAADYFYLTRSGHPLPASSQVRDTKTEIRQHYSPRLLHMVTKGECDMQRGRGADHRVLIMHCCIMTSLSRSHARKKPDYKGLRRDAAAAAR